MKAAVLVVDVQQGLCEGAGAPFDCDGTIARINDVTRRARRAATPVILVQHESSDGGLAHGSPAWSTARGLEVLPGDVRVRKTTPDSFLRTDLKDVLSAAGVESVIICGMFTEFCIDTTARRALALGFAVTLVSDAHTAAVSRLRHASL